jgi:energy-converting hydrogenase Eha subunit E
MAENRHPGISMQLPVGAGFIGLVFTVGCALIFFLALPELWYFVAFSAVLGIGVAILLRLVTRHRSERSKPLSILSVNEKTEGAAVQEHDGGRNRFHAQPRFCSS